MGFLVGLVTTALLVFMILREESIQPYQNHRLTAEVITQPLTKSDVFRERVIIPDSLAGGTFMIALFFGSNNPNSCGGIKITLSQDSQVQTHRAVNLAPSPSLRRQFRFNGYSAGPAQLEVEGIEGNTDAAPGLLYHTQGDGYPLHGPGLTGPAYLMIDWFKVFEGSEKLTNTFPNFFISIVWLLPFSGLMALGWAGAGIVYNKSDLP